jgi:hypothetical protein
MEDIQSLVQSDRVLSLDREEGCCVYKGGSPDESFENSHPLHSTWKEDAVCVGRSESILCSRRSSCRRSDP